MNFALSQWELLNMKKISQQALKTAQQKSRTKSELARKALRYCMERRTMESFLWKLSKTVQSMGIRSESDVERLIDEDRAA